MLGIIAGKQTRTVAVRAATVTTSSTRRTGREAGMCRARKASSLQVSQDHSAPSRPPATPSRQKKGTSQVYHLGWG